MRHFFTDVSDSCPLNSLYYHEFASPKVFFLSFPLRFLEEFIPLRVVTGLITTSIIPR